MKTFVIVIVLMLTVVTPSSPSATAQEHQEPVNVWGNLRFKTGWITIGILTSSGEWAGGEPGFEIIVKRNTEQRVLLPSAGDRIRLTLNGATLWILDFQTSGEAKRLVSPTTRPRFEKTDETGVTLPPGTFLTVEEVQIEKPVAGLKGVWVRVSPAVANEPGKVF